LSLAEVTTEWNSKRCSRYSIHSEIGILWESNTVPVSGLNLLPHDRQRYFCMPSFLFPSLTKFADPQDGHPGSGDAFTIEASAGVSFRCFSEYHSDMVESAILSVGERGFPFRFGYDFKEPAQLGSRLFMFGGSLAPGAG